MRVTKPNLFELLTRKEIQVLTLLAGGMSNLQIANRLNKSPRTVEQQRYAIHRKVGTQSIAELTHLALRAGLIELLEFEALTVKPMEPALPLRMPVVPAPKPEPVAA